MTKCNVIYRLLRFLPVMILGAFIMAFSCSASTVQAADEVQVVEENEAEVTDESSGLIIMLMGGMLVIIIAVVLSVVGTVVSTVATVEAGE